MERPCRTSPAAQNVTEPWRPRRVFIFYPAINERLWRVLWKGSTEAFSSEGRAVEFALACAARGGGSRMVEVVQETVSGGWLPVRVPTS